MTFDGRRLRFKTSELQSLISGASLAWSDSNGWSRLDQTWDFMISSWFWMVYFSANDLKGLFFSESDMPLTWIVKPVTEKPKGQVGLCFLHLSKSYEYAFHLEQLASFVEVWHASEGLGKLRMQCHKGFAWHVHTGYPANRSLTAQVERYWRSCAWKFDR